MEAKEQILCQGYKSLISGEIVLERSKGRPKGSPSKNFSMPLAGRDLSAIILISLGSDAIWWFGNAWFCVFF
jgi:hypothetical protein